MRIDGGHEAGHGWVLVCDRAAIGILLSFVHAVFWYETYFRFRTAKLDYMRFLSNRQCTDRCASFNFLY
jgi:hypothetical protein